MLRYSFCSPIIVILLLIGLLRCIYQVSMATKMATIDKAEELLEKLRAASWDAAVKGNYVGYNFNTVMWF